MCGMVKTTLYLPEELKAELEDAARAEGRSEAELIREAIAKALQQRASRRPTPALFSSGDPSFARRIDELLEGFGGV